MERLDYERSTVDRPGPTPLLDLATQLAIIAPFLTVPFFLLGAALLQDDLINGDGRSWLRAALWMGVPTAIISLAALCGAVSALARDRTRRKSAIFAIRANAVSLVIIASGIIAAA